MNYCVLGMFRTPPLEREHFEYSACILNAHFSQREDCTHDSEVLYVCT